MLNEFTEEAGYLTGRAYSAAEAAFRREQRDFDKLCDAIRKRNERGAAPRPAPKPKPKARATERSCWHCGAHFSHPEKRGPAPKFCSNAHRAAFHRATAKTIKEAVARSGWRPKKSRGGQAVNLKGKRFTRLLVLEPAHTKETRGSRPWLVRCDCGAEFIQSTKRLRSGEAKSCGCLRGTPRVVEAA